ncbi:MAG: hypothetical protein V4489_09445 [Chlamydiota bacterium]
MTIPSINPNNFSIEKTFTYIGAGVVIGSATLGIGYLIKTTYSNAQQIEALKKVNLIKDRQISDLQEDIHILSTNQENFKNELNFHSVQVHQNQTHIKRVESTITQIAPNKKKPPSTDKQKTNPQSQSSFDNQVNITTKVEETFINSQSSYNRPQNLYSFQPRDLYPTRNRQPDNGLGLNRNNEPTTGTIVSTEFLKGASYEAGKKATDAVTGLSTMQALQTGVSLVNWLFASPK